MGQGYAHLSAEERELIAIGVAQGCSRRAIACHDQPGTPT